MSKTEVLRGNRQANQRETSLNPSLASARRIMRNPSGIVGVTVLAIFTMVALLAPLLAPFDPLAQHAGDELKSPGAAYLLGTDEFGRDILSRIICGARISLGVGIVSMGIGFAIGALTGIISGFLGGWVDVVVNRLWDSLLAFPPILLGIGVVAVLGPGAINTAIAVGILNIPIFSRLARACALTEKEKDYVLAARALGGSDSRIAFHHILPNALSPLLVQMAVAVAFGVILEASLSFLGLGTQPPDPSWGSMMSESRQFLRDAWWYGLFPGVALTILVVGLNFLSDALRDAFDPRQINLGR
jgi:peptide/nickel transport system permease protein